MNVFWEIAIPKLYFEEIIFQLFHSIKYTGIFFFFF